MIQPCRAVCHAALALALWSLASCATPSHHAVHPVDWREPQVDINHYDIDITLDHEAGYVEGTVEILYRGLPERPSTELVLDAVDLEITGVWNGEGRALRTERRDDTLVVFLERPALPGIEGSVRLAWSCFPKTGFIFVPPSKRAPRRSWQVWTQGQSEDTRHWMPVWDIPNEMATHQLTVTLDASLMSIGAGELVDSFVLPRTGQRTETWRSDLPHVSYLITFLAGDFARGELGGGEVPLPVLSDPDDLSLAMENSRHTADILAYLGELTGLPYPYSKYAQTYVRDFTAGGMENVSATTLYDEGIHDSADEPRNDVTGLLAHEAAHQWFGDLLCGRGWKELWLNEGFANYCEALYMGHLEGASRVDVILRRWQQAYMTAEWEDSHPIIWENFPDPDAMFDEHVYEGGAARLHLLSDQIGEEAFLAGLRAFVHQHSGQVVETADLQRAMEEASGRPLQRFFDEWLYGPGYPTVEATLDDDTVLHLEQRATKPGWRSDFHAELEVTWSRNGTERSVRASLGGQPTEVPLPGAGALDWVRADSRGVLPGRITLVQPAAAWRRQLTDPTDPVTRLIAADWFAGDPWVLGDEVPAPDLDEEALAVLNRVAREDPFPDVRVRALQSLSASHDESTRVTLIDLVVDEDPRVREAAVRALGAAPGEDGLAVLRSAVDDTNAQTVLAAMTALVDLDDPGAYRTLTRILRDSGSQRVRLARDLVTLASTMDDPDVLPLLMRVSRMHTERWVRAAAVDALATRDGPHAERIFQQLCASLNDESYSVREAAARALAARGDRRAVRHLRARLDLEGYVFVVTEIHAALAQLDN
jgi:aminopeptidase N